MSKISVTKIAELSGVSRATAYRALSGSEAVSAQLRVKIMHVAREHGYFTSGLRNVAIILPCAPLRGYLTMLLDCLLEELWRQKYLPERL